MPSVWGLANNGGWVSSGRNRYALGTLEICVTTKLRNTAGFCRSPYYIYIRRLKTKDLPALSHCKSPDVVLYVGMQVGVCMMYENC